MGNLAVPFSNKKEGPGSSSVIVCFASRPKAQVPAPKAQYGVRAAVWVEREVKFGYPVEWDRCH